MLVAVSRAPYAKIAPFHRRMGWPFKWVSSAGSDFNFDFHVSFTQDEQHRGGSEYNFRPLPPRKAVTPEEDAADRGPAAQMAAMTGTDTATYIRERPGLSTFVLDGGKVYHAYSTYSRGVDGIWGMYQWLDRAPLGRNEKGPWWRRHDEYPQHR